MIVLSEESLKKVFGAIWSRFLEFEITRSKLMCEVAGNPLSALILQVVAYHNLTLVQSAVDNKTYKKKVWRHPSLPVLRLQIARNWSLLFANNRGPGSLSENSKLQNIG